MKRAFLFLTLFLQMSVFSFALRDYDKKPKGERHLSRVLRKYKKDDLIKNLRSFVKDTRPTRIVGSPGHQKSVKYIYDYIKTRISNKDEVVIIDEFTPDIDHGIDMYKSDLDDYLAAISPSSKNVAQIKRFKNFTASRIAHLNRLRGVKGRNIIWEKKGSVAPDKVIIIGAHFDTIAYDKTSLTLLANSAQPGADNNASGVAIALALIETLSELQLKNSVRIVFFDYQELGFLGSLDYARKVKLEIKSKLNVVSFVNLLMLGHDSKLRDKEKRYGNMKLYYSEEGDQTNQSELVVVNDLLKRGKKASVSVKFSPLGNGFKNGDGVSFQAQNIAALTFTQNWESDFNADKLHTSKDFVETLNFKTYYESFLFIGQAIASWALAL